VAQPMARPLDGIHRKHCLNHIKKKTWVISYHGQHRATHAFTRDSG
jgi:hypothetical protein